MSSYLVIDQKPRPPATGFQCTGSLCRSQVKTSCGILLTYRSGLLRSTSPGFIYFLRLLSCARKKFRDQMRYFELFAVEPSTALTHRSNDDGDLCVLAGGRYLEDGFSERLSCESRRTTCP